ncbi:MAG: cyclase family protein, partial [Pyrinomonadaceae bacterium]
MEIILEFGQRRIELSDPIDISIPLDFNGPQPNAYGVEPASSRACEYSDLIGDTRRGGSCNFEEYTLIPHCSGTHTECVGHITNERISVRDCLRDVFIPAVLVSVTPTRRDGSDDLVITRETIEAVLSQPAAAATGFQSAHHNNSVQQPAAAGGSDALIVRT